MKARRLDQGEFEACSEEWKRVLAKDTRATIFDTWEWYATYWRHHRKGELHVLAVTDNGKPLAFAPLFMETKNFMGLAIKRISFLGTDRSDYGRFITSNGTGLECLAAIVEYFNREYTGWDIIDLRNVPASSELLQIGNILSKKWRLEVSPASVCRYLRITDWTRFLSAIPENDRGHIARAERHLDGQRGIEIHTTKSLEQLEDDFNEFMRLHLLRKGQASAFAGFKERGFLNDVVRTFMAEGWLDLTFLSKHAVNASAILGFKFGRKYYSYISGLDNAVRNNKEGLGMVHHTYLVRRAFRDGFEEFDFLRGDEQYKRRWANSVRRNYHITIGNTKPYSLFPVLANTLAKNRYAGSMYRVLHGSPRQ